MLRLIVDRLVARRFRHHPLEAGASSPRAQFARGSLWSLALLVCLGCASDDGSGGDVGSPCDVDEDCRSGLVCDIHDGRGSCQEPHHHDDSEAGDEDEHSQH